MNLYYIHTEKYSPKSKWVLANQRSELWFSHVKKMIRPIRIANEVFYMWENDTSNQKPQRCVSCAPKFPPFLAACWAPLRTHSRREVFLKKFFFSLKKVKNISEMEWNSFVCFTVDKENCGEPVKQQRKGKNRTRRKLMLCFLSELLCPFYLNSLIFNCTFRTNS